MDVEQLLRLVAAMLPVDVAVGACAVGSVNEPPFPQEAQFVKRAVLKRRQEFAAGRWAAHQAIVALGHGPSPVAMDDDRCPRFPPGLYGSIAHSRYVAVAVVGRRQCKEALGIDVEDKSPLPLEVIPVVCLREEITRLEKWSHGLGEDAAKLIFSAKEAVYKNLFPEWRRVLEFSDVEIEVDVATRQFSATVQIEPEHSIKRLGAFTFGAGHVLTSVHST